MRFVIFAALTLVVTPASAADWPQFLGPNRDSHSAETKLNWNWPKAGPKQVWSTEVGTGWAGPIVAAGKLILFHRVENEEILAALDPATGKEVWSAKYPTKYRDDFQFDNGPRATPLAIEGKLFTLGANGDFHGWELATGKKLWGRNLLADYKSPKGFFGVACSPVMIGGKLLLNVGAKGAGIVAFDPADGKELWKATDDPASYSSPAGGADFDGKPSAVFLTRSGLRILEAATGKSLYDFPWRPRDANSVNAATPLVWKDEIFLTVSYATGAAMVKAKGGELTEVWTGDKSLSCQYSTPVRVGGYLYGIHGRADAGTAELRCVEWTTGKVKWGEPKFGVSAIIAVDSGLLALTEAGDLVRFDASADGYKERARASILAKPTRAAPALADGRFFARDGTKLVCYSLKKE